jgi:hypothetical protein
LISLYRYDLEHVLERRLARVVGRNAQFLTKWGLVVFLLAVVAGLGRPATAQAVIADLRTNLLSTAGQPYVEARQQALALPSAALADLIALLELADPISQDHIIAAALRARSEHPETADEFDQHLQESIDHPDTKNCSGRPLYSGWFPEGRLDLDPLVFEAILKLELPGDMSGSFMDGFMHANPANINPLFYFTTHGKEGTAFYLAWAAADNVSEQARITPILVQIHKTLREQGSLYGCAIHPLTAFGGPQQLAALLQIKAFEQTQMPAQGVTPWSDPNIDADSTAASIQRQAIAHSLESTQGQPAAVLANLQQQLEQADAQVELCRKRLYARGLWQDLNEGIEKLQLQVQPPSPPQSQPQVPLPPVP